MKSTTPILFALLLLLLGALVVFAWPYLTGDDLVKPGGERATISDLGPSSDARERSISLSRPAPAAALSSHETSATLVTVRVLRADTRGPCPDVHMTVMVDRDGALSEARPAVTDAHGEWSGPVVGPCEVSVALHGGSERRSHCEVATGQRSAALDVVLPNSNAVRGRVTRPDGSPVPHVPIVALLGSTAQQIADLVGESDGSGEFQLVGLRPGLRLLAFSTTEGLSDSYTVNQAPEQTLGMVVHGEGELVLSMEGGSPPFDVMFSVDRDGQTFDPASGNWVHVSSNESIVRARLPASQRWFRVRDRSLAAATGKAAVASGVVTEARLVLDSASLVRGVVEDDAGKPIEAAMVFVWGRSARDAIRTDTDASGRFSAVVEHGEVTARAVLRARGIDERQKAPADGERFVKIVVPAFTRRLRVVSETKEPLEGWSVAFSRDQDATPRRKPAKSDADGWVHLPGRTTTKGEVSVWAPSLGAWPPAVTLTDDWDGDFVAEVPIGKWGSARATVGGAGGEYEIQPVGGGGVLRLRREGGEVTTPLIPAGEYSLICRFPMGGSSTLEKFRIEEGRVTDLGTLSSRFGLLRVEITGNDTASTDVRVTGHRDGGGEFGLWHAATRWPIELPCGSWNFFLIRGGQIAAHHTAEIKAGETAVVRHAIPPAAPVLIEAVFPSSAEAVDVSVQMKNAEGGPGQYPKLVVERESSEARWKGEAAVGDWTITGTCPDGRRQSAIARIAPRSDGSPTVIRMNFPGAWPAEGESVRLDFTDAKFANGAPDRLSFQVMGTMPRGRLFSGIAWKQSGRLESSRLLPFGEYAVTFHEGAETMSRTFMVVPSQTGEPVVVVVK